MTRTDASLLLRLPWAERSTLRDVLREHPLVYLPTPGLEPGGVMDLAESIGLPELPLRVGYRLEHEPRLMRFGNLRDGDGRKLGASALRVGWHADATYRSRPPHVSLLYCHRTPPEGGQTQFCSLFRLLEEFDASERASWRDLQIEHEATSDYFDRYEDRVCTRPLIWRHPESGRELVQASPAYAVRIVGWPEERSRALLDRLAAACDPPDHVHSWHRGDLLVWDNQALLHRASPYDEAHPREMWRAQVFLHGRD